MNYDEIYKNAYLKQLNIIKEEAEDETEAPAETVEESDLTEECCGKECCGKDCKPAEECGEINEDAEDGEGDDETQDIEDTPVQKVCFLTSDQALIDALNGGFEEIVIFTNVKDEETGEETVNEVKFGKDSFGELTVTEAETEVDEDVEEDVDVDVVEEDDEVEVVEEDDEEVVEEDGEEEVDVVEEDDEDDEEAEDSDDEEEKEIETECKKTTCSAKSKYGPY
jgi:hypothetical protein